MPNKKKKSAGFTLIELLVVVLVISALSGILLNVINSSGIRGKARDSQRKADLKRIQTALELYFADNRVYPISNAGAGPGTWEPLATSASQLIALLEPDYIDPVPLDPNLAAGTPVSPCTQPARGRYNYKTSVDGATYLLTAIMEVSSSNDDSACADNVGCVSPYDTEDFCYYVQNP